MQHFPLLQLPGLALEALLALLSAHDQCRLRLCSWAATAAVDSHRTQLTVTQHGPRKSLQQRFPRLAQLRFLHVCDVSNDTASAAAWQPLLDLSQHGHWTGVTSLRLSGVQFAVANEAIQSCPSATHCSLQGISGDQQPSDKLLDEVPISRGESAVLTWRICSSLPTLTALSLSHDLGDPDLHALARCSSLTQLETTGGILCSAKGLESLCSMRLATLSMRTLSETLPPCALPALSGLTALTQLTLQQPHDDWRNARLPASLVSLRHQHSHGIPPACQQLPQLTALTSPDFVLFNEAMAFLAAKCPALARLSARGAELDVECHATPLLHLTELKCEDSFFVDAGVRIAVAFPALHTLHLRCEAAFEDRSMQSLQAAQGLQHLDLGAFYDPHGPDGPSMAHTWTCHIPVTGFSVLGTLPNLRHMRLDAVPDHIEGISLHCTGLQSITWVCFVIPMVKEAFGTFAAPQQLHTARIEFPERLLHEVVASDGEVFHSGLLQSIDLQAEQEEVRALRDGLTLASIASSAIGWLLTAPRLSHVEWVHDEAECAAWNDAMLCAVAGHTPVQLISLFSFDPQDYALGDITPGALARVKSMHAARGLKVEVHGTFM